MPPIYIGSRPVIARYIGSRPVQAVMYRGEDLLGGQQEPSPYPLTGLIYYINATDRSSANITQSSNKVSAIADKSPSSNAAAYQESDTRRPTTNLSTLLGGNALHFKSQDRLVLPTALNAIGAMQNFTVYVSYATDMAATSQDLITWMYGATVMIGMARTSTGNVFTFGAGATKKVTVPAASTTGPRIIAMRRTGAVLTGFTESASLSTSESIGDLTLSSNPLLGGGFSTAAGNFVGAIREVMIYSEAHTAEQVADVMGYMSRAETVVLLPPVCTYAPVLWGGNDVGDEYHITDGYWQYDPDIYAKVIKKNGVVVTQPYYKTIGDAGVLTAEVTATNQDGSGLAVSNSIDAAAAYDSGALVRLNGTNRSQSSGLTDQLAANHNAGGALVRGEFRNKISVGRYPLINPSFVFPNWGVLTGDQPGPSQITLDVCVEDIASTVVAPITFSGADTKTILPGNNADSDHLVATFAPFSEFYLRVGVQVPDASGSFFDGVAANGAPGVFSTRTPAESQINALGPLAKNAAAGESSLNYYTYGPVAIIGEMPVGAVSVALFGDSIGAGGFLRLGVENAARGRIPAADYCRPGEFLQSFFDNVNGYRADCAQYHTHCICQFGANDMTSSYGFETQKARYLLAWEKIKAQGQHVAQCTIFPRQASPTDPTPYHANFLPGGVRDQLNDWFLTRVGFEIDAVIDASVLVEAAGNPNGYNSIYTSDGTHLSASGKAIAAQAVTAWANTLP